MLRARSIASTVAVFALSMVGSAAQSQDTWREDVTPCSGSAPQPAQSDAWRVAFCNRTGHDLVVEFHDNDCPAQNWGRRGDIYRKSIRRGESVTLSLCYANESQPAAVPAPGIPTLRIPGGKGVVTTWSVVGDCGDRSDHLYLDARTFYDRGDYKTGIIFLQYPAGASHCVAGLSNTTTTPPPASSTSQAQHPDVHPPVGTAPAPAATAPDKSVTEPSASTEPAFSGNPPALTAAKYAKDILGRTVRVFAATEKGAPTYNCSFTLALTFTDGGTWNDRVQTNVSSGQPDSPIATRKYGKSISKVVLASSKCATL